MSKADTDLRRLLRRHRSSDVFPGKCEHDFGEAFPCAERKAAQMALAAPLLAESLAAAVVLLERFSEEDAPCGNDDCALCPVLDKARAALQTARGDA